MNHHDAITTCIPRLRRYALVLLGDRHRADDLVQDTLERALQKFHLWRSESEIRPWLFSIMHNLHVDQYRTQPRHLDPLDTLGFELSTRATQEDALTMRDLLQQLSQLPDEQRSILLLVAVEQLAYKDIARILGIPIGTVMSRLSRAREHLRRIQEEAAPTPHLKVTT
ncbi:MAG: RNA polymerase sigma factor [Halothiobacillus sp.]